MTTITYLEHSGFFLELDTCCILFDYWKGEIPNSQKPLYVFVSHAHEDHFNPAIFHLSKQFKQVVYVLANDIKGYSGSQIHLVEPNQSYIIDMIRVKTLASTDEGVAYLVDVDGLRIFHSGDLHWWHWEEEQSEAEKAIAKQAFFAQLEKLKGNTLDMAFLVLDPRQQDQFDWGMRAFLDNVSMKTVFPMHFWGDYNAIKRFKKEAEGEVSTSNVIEIHHTQEVFEL